MDGETVSPGQSRCEAVKQWGTVEGQCWTSQGSAPESFTPVCYNLPQVTPPGTAEMENKGNVWDVGTVSIPWGKANYRLKAPLSVCGMQLR